MGGVKTVWIARARLNHSNGHSEDFICGVYATQPLAVESCKTWWAGDYNYTVSYYDDGDAYLYEIDGHRSFVIQRWSVEIPNRTELSVGQHEATCP